MLLKLVQVFSRCFITGLMISGPLLAQSTRGKLCKVSESERIFIIENNTEATLIVNRYYPLLPEFSPKGVNLGIEQFGEVPPLSERRFEAGLKIGKNKMVMVIKCNGQVLMKTATKPLSVKEAFNDRRQEKPGCKRRRRVIVVTRDIGITPFSCSEDLAANFGGDWNCPGRGFLSFIQNGSTITGGAFGGAAGEDWSSPHDGNVANGTVTANSLHARLNHNNGTYSIVDVVLAGDKLSFSGGWKWYSSSNTFITSGTWGCQR